MRARSTYAECGEVLARGCGLAHPFAPGQMISRNHGTTATEMHEDKIRTLIVDRASDVSLSDGNEALVTCRTFGETLMKDGVTRTDDGSF